jgi:hypothetical protein
MLVVVEVAEKVFQLVQEEQVVVEQVDLELQV